MATRKCKNAVSKLVGNGGNVTQAMIEAGYSKNTAHTPSKLTESKGYKEVCEEYGLTDSLILKCLVDDIKGKPLNRKPELELGAKITGLLVDRKELSGVNGKDLIPSNEHKQASINAIQELLNDR